MALRFVLLSLLLTAASPAAADSLYRCTGPGGAVSIQSEPCPPGSTQDWKRDASPEPGPTPEELDARTALAQAEAERAAEMARVAEQRRLAEAAVREEQARLRAAIAEETASAGPPARKSECTLAHDYSDATAAKPWLDLTQAQRERIRQWVVQQCRDPAPPLSSGGSI